MDPPAHPHSTPTHPHLPTYLLHPSSTPPTLLRTFRRREVMFIVFHLLLSHDLSLVPPLLDRNSDPLLIVHRLIEIELVVMLMCKGHLLIRTRARDRGRDKGSDKDKGSDRARDRGRVQRRV